MSLESLCGVALCCCAASLILKGIKPEFALLAGVAGGAVLLFASLGFIAPVTEFISELTYDGAYASYYTVLIKASGVALLTHCASEICRDCGENRIGDKLETAGKLSIVLMSLPVIKKLFEMAKELIK